MTQIKDGEKKIEKREFKVRFDFTTVSGKSRFTGRSAECNISLIGEDDLDPKDKELIQVCAQSVYSQKPSWKIVMLNIKEITPL